MTPNMFLLILQFVIIKSVISTNISEYQFPDDFLFGASTSSYQIEGAWNKDGKRESIWDRSLHENQDVAIDASNGDIACDSYHKYKEDTQLLKELGVDFYRFSVSWPRILLNGTADYINQAEIDHYNNLIDELLANGIQPFITMYHWDLPQVLQDQGGWIDRSLADYFVHYARVLFENFGDRVKYWMTFNEIIAICENGYSDGVLPPFISNPGVGGYECIHVVLLAHGKTYRMYDSEFREKQKGQIGVASTAAWYEPNDPDSESDRKASNVGLDMNYGWFVEPMIRSNYPDVLVERVRNMSLHEGYNQSRLPEFTPEEQEMMNGTLDFLGLNLYSTFKVSFDEEDGTHPSHTTDTGIVLTQDPSWPSSASSWIKVEPTGIRKMLVWIKNHYDNIPVLITENGYPDTGGLEDYDRAITITKSIYMKF